MPDIVGEFSPVEHLKNVLIRTYNKMVKEEFKDIEDEEGNLLLGRGSLKKACLIKSNDSQILINNRMMLFYFILRQAQDLQAPIYGIPTGTYHETFKFKPQICLYFREDIGDVEDGYQPLRTQIKFRLMNETETTISKAELTTIATRIKNEFGNLGKGFRWKRGKALCTYSDPESGYHLQLYAWSSSEAKEVIKKVLSLTNTTYDSSKFNTSVNENESGAFPTIPPFKTIVGKKERLPRKRPVGYVRFTHSTCQIWGRTKPVTLYDRVGLLRDGLVE